MFLPSCLLHVVHLFVPNPLSIMAIRVIILIVLLSPFHEFIGKYGIYHMAIAANSMVGYFDIGFGARIEPPQLPRPPPQRQ